MFKLKFLAIPAALLFGALFAFVLISPASATTPSCIPSQVPNTRTYPKPCPSVSKSASPSVSVSASASTSASASSSVSVSASTSASATPAPTPGQSLPLTGQPFPWVWIVVGGVALLVGAGILAYDRRQKATT